MAAGARSDAVPRIRPSALAGSAFTIAADVDRARPSLNSDTKAPRARAASSPIANAKQPSALGRRAGLGMGARGSRYSARQLALSSPTRSGSASRTMTTSRPRLWREGRADAARAPGVSMPTVALPLPRPLSRCGRGRWTRHASAQGHGSSSAWMRAQAAVPSLERPGATSRAGVRRRRDGQRPARAGRGATRSTRRRLSHRSFDGARGHGGGPCGGGLGTAVGGERRWTATTRQRARGA